MLAIGKRAASVFAQATVVFRQTMITRPPAWPYFKVGCDHWRGSRATKWT
jgi:hypothetical protein